MKYKLDFSPKLDISSPPVTGAIVGAAPTVFLLGNLAPGQ